MLNIFKKVVAPFFLFYTLFGFYVLPLLLVPIIEKVAAKESYSVLNIQKIEFNPFTFEAKVDGVLLKSLGGEKMVSIGTLELDAEPHSLVSGALHVKTFSVDKLELFVVRNKDGSFNFEKIIKPKEDEESKTPRVIFDNFVVKNSSLKYEDFTNSKEYKTLLLPLDVKLANIDTADFSSKNGNFSFYTKLSDGGEIDIKATIKKVKPLKIDGNIKISSFDIHTKWQYFQDKTELELTNGTLLFGAKYSFDIDDLNSTKISDMYVGVNDLSIKSKKRDGEILSLKSLLLSDMVLYPMKRDLHVKNLTLDKLETKAKRYKDGSIDWSEYLKTPKSDQSSTTTKEQSTPWRVEIDNISLKKIGANLTDISVSPAVNTKLNELNLVIKNFSLLGEKPFFYEANMLLNEKFACSLNGDIKLNELAINSDVKCNNFDFMHYRPYIDQSASRELKTYAVLLKSASADFDFEASLKKDDFLLKEGNFYLNNFVLAPKYRDEKLCNFKKLSVKNIGLSTKQKSVEIQKIALDSLGLNASMDENLTLSFLGLIEPKDAKKESSKEDGFAVKLKTFELNSAKIDFLDKSVQTADGGVKTTIDNINLTAKNIDLKERNWLDYALSMRVNGGGFVKSNGKLKHSPLEQNGEFLVDRVSLKELNPYMQEKLFLNLKDGYISLKSKTALIPQDKKPDLIVDGSFKIEEFFLHDSRNNDALLSFTLADLSRFKYRSNPNSLFVDEMVLNSFYINAQVNSDKSFNLAQLQKESAQHDMLSVKDLNQTQNKSEAKKDNPFSFKLMNLKVANGSANFADYSLPIQFKTYIHNLNGNIYAISNAKGEISYIDMNGEVDKYGSTLLRGSIESSNVKSYLDIDFNFRNLNLSSASGYSTQFTGYKIDQGKLFLDLKYNIIDSKLLSKNKILIKQIKLGDEIKDANVTKLPLSFAIALLEDKDGIIDINLPVEGNVDDPDFKYGALIFKTFVNLIVKAVASPFKFLGSLMGFDAEKLKSIDFESGEATILPPEREKLDNLCDMLEKKPKLSIVVSGGFNTAADTRALQIKKLKGKALAMSNQEYLGSQVLEKIYNQKGFDPKVLKNEIATKTKKELVEIMYQKELLDECIKLESVSSDELKALANKRAKAVEEYLVVTKKVAPLKITLSGAKESPLLEDGLIETAVNMEVK